MIGALLVSADRRRPAGQPPGDVDPVHRRTTRRCARWAGRPAGCAAWRCKDGDSVLSVALVREGSDLVVATANGYVKRTDVAEYRIQRRGGYGTQAAKTTDDRGELVGALVVDRG